MVGAAVAEVVGVDSEVVEAVEVTGVPTVGVELFS